MTDEDTHTRPDRDLWLIGIAASAGGLEAIRTLLHAAPHNVSAAWIIAQHMSPTHRSMLAQILARDTHLAVVELSGPTVPVRGHVYVVPPNHDVDLQGGRIVLGPPSDAPGAPKPSANRLFKGIAREWGKHSIGIVLSGTGSDGAQGIEALHEADALTFAQDTASANYDGMPSAAVMTGCVDLVLPPAKIAHRLTDLGTASADAIRAPVDTDGRDPLGRILDLLLEHKQTDFRDYKSPTVLRRIDRRMNAIGTKNLTTYARYCQENPSELDALFQDFLISVTSFFRDPREFEAMAPVFADLAAKPAHQPIRIWSSGCATGEEAYTLAILMTEALGGVSALAERPVQILASDIDPVALAQARSGRFAESALETVPGDLAERYFVQRDGGVEIVPELKQCIVFSQHNVVQDPPFIKIDLICCRNLLIYFGSALQSDVLHTFHYSLNEDGVLFLGTAENVSVSADYFEPVGAAANAYRRLKGTGLGPRVPRRRNVDAQSATRTMLNRIPAPTPAVPISPVNGLVKALVSAMDRPALLLDRDLRILSVFGSADGFVSLRDGSTPEMDHHLLADPLPQDVRLLSAQAVKSRKAQTGLQRDLPGVDGPVSLTVFPLMHGDIDDQFILVTFNTAPPDSSRTRANGEPAPAAHLGPGAAQPSDGDIARELAVTQDALQATLEEWETANEELRCLNQELQANNEELQTINEELETSNEELQSTNQELISVNQSARVAHEEVNTLKNDLETILREVDVPLLIVNRALKVTRTSEAADRIFASDGRTNIHISQMGLPPGCPPLAPVADRVLSLGMPETVAWREGPDETTLSIRPFASQQGAIIGLSIVLLARSAERTVTGAV